MEIMGTATSICECCLQHLQPTYFNNTSIQMVFADMRWTPRSNHWELCGSIRHVDGDHVVDVADTGAEAMVPWLFR
jgi:hypothetical protein